MVQNDFFDMPGMIAGGELERFGSWSLGIFGELLIDGSGIMPDWKMNDQPWYWEREQVIVASLSDGITTVGAGTFRGCSNLIDVALPKVEFIGCQAFQYCSSLTAIALADGLFAIGWAAFEGCTGLTAIEIPKSVKRIGHYAFRDCTALTEITIPECVQKIGASAFEGCTGLRSAVLPARFEDRFGEIFGDLDPKIASYI